MIKSQIKHSRNNRKLISFQNFLKKITHDDERKEILMIFVSGWIVDTCELLEAVEKILFKKMFNPCSDASNNKNFLS